MAWATEVLNRVLDEVANVLNVKVKNADTEPIPTKVTNDESDPVNTKLTGSNVADGSSVEGVSFEIDDNGYPVLRIVDSAPFAYNPGNETIQVETVNREKVVTFEETLPVVAASDSHVVTVQPPAGELWEVVLLRMYASAPSGATSGSHEFTVQVSKWLGDYQILDGRSNYGSLLNFVRNSWDIADSRQRPSDTVLQMKILEGMVATNDNPLYVNYLNNTDVASGSNNIVKMVLRSKNVVSW